MSRNSGTVSIRYERRRNQNDAGLSIVKLALGWKSHSGWAALVVAGLQRGQLVVTDRRRVELIDELWQKQPYHAAETLEPRRARELVASSIAAVRQVALREMLGVIERESARGNRVASCAVLVGKPMPDWSVDEILAVHIRMHKAEGVLYQDALTHAAHHCGLHAYEVTASQLSGLDADEVLSQQVIRLGKELGPPWGMDQKDAARGAYIALRHN